MKARHVAALMAALAACGLPAFADPVTPEHCIEVFEASGGTDMKIAQATDDEVLIRGNLDSYFISVRLSGCDSKGCIYATPYARFDLNRDPDLADYKRINAFNDSYPTGRAFLIVGHGDNGAGVDYNVRMDDENKFGSAEVATFRDVLKRFVADMNAP